MAIASTSSPEAVDAARFERLVRLGRDELSADAPEQAAQTLRAALDCWRGEPFGDLAVEPALRGEAVRLGELRLGAVADRVDADLLLGRHVAVVEELDVLCQEHPFDERLRGLHMRALYGAGRQRDALLVLRGGPGRRSSKNSGSNRHVRSSSSRIRS